MSAPDHGAAPSRFWPCLYVYYRVAAADVARCADAVNAALLAACRAEPGLQAELLRRPDADAQGLITLMESYRLDAGLPETIDAGARAAVRGFVVGERHAEAFVPCAPEPLPRG